MWMRRSRVSSGGRKLWTRSAGRCGWTRGGALVTLGRHPGIQLRLVEPPVSSDLDRWDHAALDVLVQALLREAQVRRHLGYRHQLPVHDPLCRCRCMIARRVLHGTHTPLFELRQ